LFVGGLASAGARPFDPGSGFQFGVELPPGDERGRAL